MSSLALSVLLSLVSAVAYAAGAIIQERVAATDDNAWHALLRNAVWWVAVVLNGVGAVLHVVALAYGPLSLVQPLGALTIVFALPMAALFVGRRAGATAWRGALMATAGLGGLLALTGNAEPHTLNGPEQVLLAAVTFGAVGALVVLSRTLRRPVLRSIVLATGAGAAFGMASVFTKTVAVEWTSGSVRSGALPLLVIAGLAAAGLFLSQAAYRGAGLTAPLATVTVVNPVVAAAIGLTLFGEHFRLGVPGTVLALSCGALAAAGLIMLTRERMNREHAEEALAGPGARRAAPAGVDGARGAEGQEDGQPSSSPDVSDAPAVPGPAPAATKSSPLPPGRAVPQVEFGTPGPLAEQQRRGGSTLRRPRSERRVQTLTPPARR
ncbi:MULTISPECIES: DMT family transporter [unclassified Streptomyces]|uniref:DMT family transporter n=1 Tax=Streptomyces TaxID=1883 RepID=UPI000BEFDE61|nr:MULTISPECIES: DMT family transporter [unclassified Streptomyces]MBK3544162.1 DMT family transporter [Streptomyces sp. MBT60]